MLEELDVFDLVLRRINRQQVLKMDDLCDIADVVFAQIQNLENLIFSTKCLKKHHQCNLNYSCYSIINIEI